MSVCEHVRVSPIVFPPIIHVLTRLPRYRHLPTSHAPPLTALLNSWPSLTALVVVPCSLYAGVVVVFALGVNATLALLEEAEAAPGGDGTDAPGPGAGASGVCADEKDTKSSTLPRPEESITHPLLSDSTERTL